MRQSQTEKIAVIKENGKVYLNIRLEYFRLKALEKIAKIMGDLLSRFLLIFFISITLIASAIAISFYLSRLLGNYALGFGCVTLFFVIGSFLLLLTKEKLGRLIGNLSIKRYFQRHCDGEQERECPSEENKSWTN